MAYASTADAKAKRAEYRAVMLAYLGGRCVICGTTQRLEIHHKNPVMKAFSVSKKCGPLFPRLIAELNKCELRCYTHHRQHHAAKHGTRSKYNLGCRCSACRAANTAHSRGEL